ncbi:MAG: MFS transporter [Natronospirillum sp.]|uniref:MFS transporter n=1 Tax=Natronospirillum sp. TaxID=2812955 RepID=UPI0025D5CE5F|nr:MFS transporter [Natronospirillum sp.]MCH8552433.1 MFS transporter [Natronospirillum sp.]
MNNGEKGRSALSIPAFRRYFLASCFSTFGLWIMRFLLGWTAWVLTESAFWVGVVSATMLIPTFVLSPVFGVVADRIRLRQGLLSTTMCLSLLAALTAGTWFAGRLDIYWLLGLALAKGMVMAAHHPMRLSMMPRLVTRALLPSGIGLSAIIFNLSRILGPAVAAGLLTLTTTGMVFALSALLFIFGAVFLLRIPDVPVIGEKTEASLLSDLWQGLTFALSTPAIRLILLLAALNGLLGRSLIELLPALSGQLLGGDANTLAMLTALAGVGSILGGLFISRQRGAEARLINLVLLALLGTSLLLYPLLLWQSLPLVATVILLLSVTMTIAGTGCQAMTQLAVEEQYRGRVLSLWTVITMGMPALGAFGLGGLADLFGFPVVLAVTATLVIAGLLWLAPGRQLWRD